MKDYFIYLFILVGFIHKSQAQNYTEVTPPFNIKTVTFTQNNQNVYPFFNLGDQFQLNFDDLYGNEEDYYFEIQHCNYNWTPSDLSKNEFLNGIDGQRIQDYENSFNTLQTYSHYRLDFPNKFCQLTKSGNYILTILNKNKEIVFTKKFVIYESLAEVGMLVKRARNIQDIRLKQNLELTIKSTSLLFQNPVQNIKVILFQNGKWNDAIVNIKPQFTIGNDLIFRYNTETQFYGGNEYLFFDNKDIRIPANSIYKVESNSGLYNTKLYSNNARKNTAYTFFPDINGNYQPRNFRAQNNDVECDYTWVYFTLFTTEATADSSIYVTGMFNNNQLSSENKMDYNAEKGIFEKAILIKQGFVNYNYTLLTSDGKIDSKNAIDGNFWETENIYNALVYYRANGERYDRVIGKGEANSTTITN
ncbi:MAG: DUF5103 domain-containing protein [Limnohabitans sp.]|nr:DUF5103 domain-containing protein [Limnohabitans sp.]